MFFFSPLLMAVTVETNRGTRSGLVLNIEASAANHLWQFQENVILSLVGIQVDDLILHVELVDQLFEVVHGGGAGCCRGGGGGAARGGGGGASLACPRLTGSLQNRGAGGAQMRGKKNINFTWCLSTLYYNLKSAASFS